MKFGVLSKQKSEESRKILRIKSFAANKLRNFLFKIQCAKIEKAAQNLLNKINELNT